MEVDFVSAMLDEIALEGLDGITISSLWIRLKVRPAFPISLDNQSEAFLWHAIKQQTSLDMYVLPKPRSLLVIDSRDLYTDKETGICLEPKTLPENIYPVKVVNKDGVRGSCQYYDVRENVSEKIRNSDISLADITTEYGERLVLVASQMLRRQALFGESHNPCLEMADLTYCILERIGRCRYEGDLMGSRAAVHAFVDHKLTHKDFFYHRKMLVNLGLIKKQIFVFRSFQNSVCKNTLAHLPRFYNLWKSRWHILVEKMCEKISQYPNNVCERKICQSLMGSDHNSFKRLMPFASSYLKLHTMRHADLYPDMPHDEHYNVNGSEKILHVISMIRKFPPDSDDDYEEDDASDKEDDKPSGERVQDFTKNSQWWEENLPNERLFLQKVYERLESTGPVGMSQHDVSEVFHLSRLEARGVIRALRRLGLVADSIFNNAGKQRIGMFVATCHVHDNQIKLRVSAAKSRLKQLYHGDMETQDVPEYTGNAWEKSVLLDTVLPDMTTGETDLDHENSPSKLRLNSELPKPATYLTETNLKRVNIILSAVREAKLIESVHDIVKMIVQAELEDPDVQGKIDRKSVLRLISRLSKAGQIRSIKTTLQSETRQKEVHFICDPSVEPTDPIVQCAIEQARLKHLTVPKHACHKLIYEKELKKQHNSDLSKMPDSVRTSFQKLKDFRSRLDLQDMTYDPKAGRRYGFAQKFKRMQIVHKLLWYHAYGYRGQVPESPEMESTPFYFKGFPLYKNTTGAKKSKGKGKGKRTPKSKRPVVSPANEKSGETKEVLMPPETSAVKDKEDILSENMTSIDKKAKGLEKDIRGADVDGGEGKKDVDRGLEKDLRGVGVDGGQGQDDLEKDHGNVFVDDRQGHKDVDCDLEKDHRDAGVDEGQGLQDVDRDLEKGEGHMAAGVDVGEGAGVKTDYKCDSEPPVYLDELSWRRYLPPLPKHKNYPKGWCLISDIILCLPLTIFCQIINVPYQVSGLVEMLNDPKQQFYPLLAVPFRISQQLLHARKYIFAFDAILTQLCQAGLISFAEHHQKEKGQTFIYVHRHASLYNTRSSLPGYMLTRRPTEDPFFRKQYTFTTSDGVDQFWSELQDVCLSTPLGRHIDFQTTHSRHESELAPDRLSITDALKAYTPQTVRDEGIIPGDGLGAGGYDSSFFFHLYRNWSVNKVSSEMWKSKLYENSYNDKRLIALRSIQERRVAEGRGEYPVLKFDDCSTHVRLPRLVPHQKLTLVQTSTDKPEEVVKTTIVHGSKGNKGGKGIKRKLTDNPPVLPTKKLIKSVAKGRKKKKIGVKKDRNRDPRDVLAQKQMQKLRVEWTAKEDSLLLLTKVANLFLCGRRSGILVPWSKVRDVMHEAFEASKDKTSYACQRRVQFAMKNPQTVLNVETFLAEALHDKDLVSEFRYRNYKSTDPGAHSAFISLLKRLRDKFFSGQYSETVSLPMTLDDLQRKYNVTVVGNRHPKRVFEEADSTESIQKAVLRDVIHSFMSLGDKKGRSHEMYLLFSQYQERLLTQVFSHLREDRMITRLKKDVKSRVLRFKQILPVNAHHLAQGYFNMLLCRLPQNVFEQALDRTVELYQKFTEDQGLLDIEMTEGGHAAVIVNLLATKNLKISMVVPDQILVLDKMTKPQPQRTKKAKVHLKYLEQKKKDREEDEAIELFEKSHPDSKLSGKNYSDSMTGDQNTSKAMDHDGDKLDQIQHEGLVKMIIQDTTATLNEAVSTTGNMPSTSSSKPTVTMEGGYMTVESDSMSYTVPSGMASRYTLSLLRNQCIDTGEVNKSNPQDWFLIKACDIKASLTNVSLDTEQGEEQQTQQVPLLLEEKKMFKIIKSLLRNHPQNFKASEEWKKLSADLLPDEFAAGKQIYRYVTETGQYGIQEHELLSKLSRSIQHQDFKYLLNNLQERHLP